MIYAFLASCPSLPVANGILLPSRCSQIWKSGHAPFTWVLLRSLRHAGYNASFCCLQIKLWSAVRASSAFMQRLLRRASRRASADASWCSAVRRRSASKCSVVRACSSCSRQPQTAYFSIATKPEQNFLVLCSAQRLGCSAVRACSSCGYQPRAAHFDLTTKPEQMLLGLCSMRTLKRPYAGPSAPGAPAAMSCHRITPHTKTCTTLGLARRNTADTWPAMHELLQACPGVALVPG